MVGVVGGDKQNERGKWVNFSDELAHDNRWSGWLGWLGATSRMSGASGSTSATSWHMKTGGCGGLVVRVVVDIGAV